MGGVFGVFWGAATAAARGQRVLLLEKNESLGKKLLITGGGRCNLTNAETDVRPFLAKFKDQGKFLFSAFAHWSVAETLKFFHERGLVTKVENEGRVFPISDSARSVWEVLVAELKKHQVTVNSRMAVRDLAVEQGRVVGVILKNNQVLRAEAVVVATGGTSRPETGSTGDAYPWLKRLGHTIIEPTPSLVPLAIKDRWVSRLAGLTLPTVKLTVWQSGVKQQSVKGKILFTHVGVSGPSILNLSKEIGELLKYGEVLLTVDLWPASDHGQANRMLQELFLAQAKKKLVNALSQKLPAALATIVVELSGIDGERRGSELRREERLKLIEIIKNFPLKVSHLLGVEKAIITSGGVALDEVDFKTMRSRLQPNLFLIGDVLNIDRPSGGYSLQLCWTTGFVAGQELAYNSKQKEAERR